MTGMAESHMRELTPQQSRRLVIALLVIYLVLLAWIVVWKLDVPSFGRASSFTRPIKLIPFVSSAEAGASAPLEVLVNMAFFVPFGLYLGMLAPSWHRWKATCIFAGASLALETTQHVISTGGFDITDVITNSAGGLLGLALLAYLRRRLGARTTAVMSRVMVAGTILALVAIGVFQALPMHSGSQYDVVVTRPSSSL